MLPPPFRAMDPADDLAWLAVADWLEEHDQPDRAELVRLTRLLRHDPTSPDELEHQKRQMELLAGGVEPCVATVTNSIGMTLAWIPPGTFSMGAPEDEEGRSEDEGPEHEVTIAKAFYLGVYAVTQGEYEQVMGSNPSYFAANGDGKAQVEGMMTDRFPVEMVSHGDAVKFCEKLSGLKKEKGKNHLYRLPTEAEWEYACRGGAGLKKSPFHFGNTLSSHQANFNGNYPSGGVAKGPYLERTCAVGSYKANPFGLYDMHGNVWEWCSDWYEEDYYASSPASDPPGGKGSRRVFRGGGWRSAAEYCSAGYRNSGGPASRINNLGFRLLLSSANKQ
jgi:formylglycine-generating enzyme